MVGIDARLYVRQQSQFSTGDGSEGVVHIWRKCGRNARGRERATPRSASAAGSSMGVTVRRHHKVAKWCSTLPVHPVECRRSRHVVQHKRYRAWASLKNMLPAPEFTRRNAGEYRVAEQYQGTAQKSGICVHGNVWNE